MATPTLIPSFDGATGWLNSGPLDPAELRGHVVLVDFWTLTCINWLRTEPFIRAWSQAYREDGLVVIGVHTPEFSFEHDVDRIRQAVTVRGIDYPVAVDNRFGVWTAFDNNYWPALYFSHLVLSSGSRDPIAFRVLLDGEPPGSSHGADVDENGNGALVDGRLYQLVRQSGEVADRTVEITFSEPGAEAYVFTFG